MIARVLAASLVLTWPALLAADRLPADGALNGKADDLVTGIVVALLVLGLVAAGWLRPATVVAVAVAIYGVAVPFLFEAVSPSECPAGASGMDCPSALFGAVYALPAVALVLGVGLVRRVALTAPHPR